MLQPGKARKISIYVNAGSTHHGFAAASAILDFLQQSGVAGATVLKGIVGADRHIRTASSVELSDDHRPIKVEWIESLDKIDALMDKLKELAGTGIIEAEDTTIVKAASPAA